MKKIYNNIPLIAEDYPDDYNSYRFISLIQYNADKYLTIVDNATDNFIACYLLELCEQVGINQDMVLAIANNWFENYYNDFPVSIAFARYGISNQTSRILRNLNIEFISRVIGPIPKFTMVGGDRINKKKKKVDQIDNIVNVTFID